MSRKEERDEIMGGYYRRALDARDRGERFTVTPDEFAEMKQLAAEIEAEVPPRFFDLYGADEARTQMAMFAGEPIFVVSREAQ